MPVIRILLAGLVALGAVLAALFAAALVVLGALTAFVLQLFRPKSQQPPGASGPRSPHSPRHRQEDVIEVETTDVSDK